MPPACSEVEREQKAFEVFKDIGIKWDLTGEGEEWYWKIFSAAII